MSRHFGHLLDAAAEAGSSGSSTSARWAFTRVAIISGPTRRPLRPPSRSTPIPGRRSRPRSSPCVTSTDRGLPLAIVRPGFIYGPRDRTVLPKLLHSLRTGRFAYFGSGDQALNCIYVKNLVDGIFLAAEVPEAVGEVFNLTDGGRVSKRQFIGRVAELAGLQAAPAADPALARLDPGHPARAAGQAARSRPSRPW